MCHKPTSSGSGLSGEVTGACVGAWPHEEVWVATYSSALGFLEIVMLLVKVGTLVS